MKILIVDDSKTTRMLIQKALVELGYQDLLFSDSGKSALEVLENEIPDMILLDWHMPEMNGLELLKKLKSVDDYSSIPVIMLTAENDMENVARAIENGAEGYLLKPVNKDLLRDRCTDIENNRTLGLKK